MCAGFETSKPGSFEEYWQVHDGEDAIACSFNCYAENREANARLIAAAPELYEALNDLIASVKSRELYEMQGEAEKAEAVLAKARGETP
ncbi:hypothetical protein AD952_09250 [Acetobacter cerevisiae]|uniref:Uncharacterized protein n=1 Tax=Acetobacter cerevisiae TaxID=178900 RepID=A0A149UTY3_9PROT|nr:hypothetical protein AD952_09250 [Acetobacter cerevisiae]